MARTKESPDIDYVIEGIFSYMGAGSQFPNNLQLIHTTLFSLMEEHKILMGDFSFDLDRPFPYCEDINFAMNCLESANLLSIQGPYLRKYRITQDLQEHFAEITRAKFTAEQLSELEKIAKEFKKKIIQAA